MLAVRFEFKKSRKKNIPLQPPNQSSRVIYVSEYACNTIFIHIKHIHY
jgi:hypothetical protein